MGDKLPINDLRYANTGTAYHNERLLYKSRENVAIPKDARCAVDDYQLTGNSASWRITCAGKEKITGSGTLTFQGRTAYSGKAQLRMQIEGQQEIQISNVFSAKRVGDCSR
jgi:Protein of unknown function (DUF3617)